MGRNANDMIGSGLPPLVVQTILGSVSDSLVATGTNQGNAFAIVTDSPTFTTVAAGAGAILPSVANQGDEKTVTNLGANALLVYPPVGGQVQNGAANAGYSVPAGKTCHFIARSGGKNWVANLSA